MKNFTTIRLRLWIPVLVFGAFTLLLLFFTVQEHHQYERNVERRMLTSLQELLARTGPRFEAFLKNGMDNLVETEIASLNIPTEVRSVVFVDDQGVVLYGSHREWLGHPIHEVLPLFERNRFLSVQKDHRPDIQLSSDRKNIIAYQPVVLAGEPRQIRPTRVGMIFMNSDLSPIKARLFHTLVVNSLSVWAVGLFLMLTLWAALNCWLTQPLFHLREVVNRFRNGDYLVRAAVTGQGELTELSQAFNAMAEEVLRNITERRKSEEALREKENRYRTLLDQATDAIFVTDMNAHLIDANREACEGLGYTREELLTLSLGDIDPDFETERHGKQVWEGLSTGKRLTIESSHRRKDGSLFPVEIHIGKLEIGGQPAILWIARDTSERKQVEAELAIERSHMQSLFEVNGSGMLVVSSTRQILQVNNQFCNLFSYSPDELVGQSARVLHIDQQHYEDWAPRFQEAKAGHPLTSTDYPWRRKDGTVFWCFFSGVKMRLPNGEYGVLWNVIDVTERKQAEEKVKEQQNFLQNALDALTHPFYIIDANDYTIKLANKASHFGEYREGTKCFQLTHDRNEPCAGDDHPCSLLEVKKTRQPVIVEHIHTDQAGMKRSVEIHAYPIFDSNGNLSQVIEYCLDISERKQGEEERRRLVTAIEQGIDSVVITDKDGMIQYVNPSFEKITGYSKEEAIGRNPRILQSGKHDALFYQEMWKTLTSGKAWQGHLINRKKDGTLFEEEVSITPVLNEAGEIINQVAVKRDVTGQMKLEEQLRQSQKMEAIGTLAGGIAHDFNNILAPILGYSEMALAKISPSDPLAGDLQQVITAAGRAKGLVQQILAFSRRAPHERKPLQPQMVVKEALKLLRASLPATIDIRADISPECGAILADPTQIHQIIMNLCTNAYHAMRESGGVLGVSLAKITIRENDSRVPSFELAPGDYVVLEVSDTGCGMEQKTLAHIFDPYFTTKGKGEGTGLGLSVAHGIIKSYQGNITVYSEPGKGTSFRVYLPRIAEAPSQTEAVDSETIPTGTERLLVVDDEAVITSMLEAILQSLGYQVTVVNDSEEVLARITQTPAAFDLLITDMTMPHLTGTELTARVLAIRPDLPVILCTGFSDLINKEQARALGIRAYLMKPVSVHELATAVRTALDKR